MTAYMTYPSPLGDILLAAEDEAMTGLWFVGQKYFPIQREDQTARGGDLPVLDQARTWLDVYFSGKAPDFTPKLRPLGTPFQQAVWEALRAIPYGGVATYGQIAQTLAARRGGERLSPRAVGGAVGRNPISILIPCHRVVGARGSLTGYAGGIDRKRALLELEGRAGTRR